MPTSPSPRLTFTCLASLALLAPLSAIAADDGIVTDRPDFVESSNVVGRGRFQIETSVLAERDKSDGVRARTYSMPTLLRYGVGDVLELRVETDGRTPWPRQVRDPLSKSACSSTPTDGRPGASSCTCHFTPSAVSA